MPGIVIQMSDQQSKKVELLKIKYRLLTKQDAIKRLIDDLEIDISK